MHISVSKNISIPNTHYPSTSCGGNLLLSCAWNSETNRACVLGNKGEYFLSHELAAPHSACTVVQENSSLEEHN